MELKKFRELYKSKSIGFVPTMGALHEGHLSLINKAKQNHEVVIASIFVNPAQFNDKKDLMNYPRMPDKDTEMLIKSGCDCLYMPFVEEIYPAGYQPLQMDFGFLEQTMEGKYRPGHFKGMAAVVHRLFSLVQPDEAFFGEKDYQQLAIVRAMAGIHHPQITVTGCPTLREADGLAMSSRNLLLTPEQRKKAPVIYSALSEGNEWQKSNTIVSAIKRVITMIESIGGFEVQYFEIVHPDTLRPVTETSRVKGMRACIAVLTGGPRLIDNMEFDA
jgi:pantoate--beta-alanine ligase